MKDGVVLCIILTICFQYAHCMNNLVLQSIASCIDKKGLTEIYSEFTEPNNYVRLRSGYEDKDLQNTLYPSIRISAAANTNLVNIPGLLNAYEVALINIIAQCAKPIPELTEVQGYREFYPADNVIDKTTPTNEGNVGNKGFESVTCNHVYS